MKTTDVRTAVAEANYGRTCSCVYIGEDVTGLGERFSAPGLPQGGICHD